LYAHPDETSRDEIELKDGMVLDRYSSPVVGKDGKYYGRIWTFRDITERKKTEVALRLFRKLIDHSKDAIVVADPVTARFVDFSESFCHDLGYTRAEMMALTVFDVSVGLDRAAFDTTNAHLKESGHAMFELEHRRKDGSTFPIEVSLSLTTLDRDYAVTIVRDITARKRLETQLFQSQKMETVGKLAGGIAHEFNSILTAIIGQSELLLGDLPTGSPLAKNAAEISQAADRAAMLTRQLLAYGRKQFLRPEALNLN